MCVCVCELEREVATYNSSGLTAGVGTGGVATPGYNSSRLTQSLFQYKMTVTKKHSNVEGLRCVWFEVCVV